MKKENTEKLLTLETDERMEYNFEDFDILKAQKETAMPTKTQMTKHFLVLAGPSVITNVFSYMVMTVNTIFAGQF